jgi:RNA polymerase sigma-70 factor, ECF subfamily
MTSEVTVHLNNLFQPEGEIHEQAVRLVYNELRRLANHHLRRERPGHTLVPTALVHEAFLRLMKQHGVRWENRTQFFAFASELMRRILVDHARRRNRLKRGGGEDAIQPDDGLLSEQQSEEILALHEALERLAKKEPRQVRIVELRFFGGLTVEEAAEALGISPKTVKRDWTVARAWLHREMTSPITVQTSHPS